MEFDHLRVVDRAGGVDHEVAAGLRLREGDDVADVVGAHDVHHEPVETERDAAVRRGAVLESPEQEAELGLRLVGAEPDQFEDLLLHVLPVDAFEQDAVVGAEASAAVREATVEAAGVLRSWIDSGRADRAALAVVVLDAPAATLVLRALPASYVQRVTAALSVLDAPTAEHLAEADPRIVAVVNDSVGSSKLNSFQKKFPDRLINVGIAEQVMVGVGAGLANGGRIPFVSAAGCFITGRALEQVKADIAYANFNVKLVGQSSGVAYGELGATHHSIEDFAWLRPLTNLTVIAPADA